MFILTGLGTIGLLEKVVTFLKKGVLLTLAELTDFPPRLTSPILKLLVKGIIAEAFFGNEPDFHATFFFNV